MTDRNDERTRQERERNREAEARRRLGDEADVITGASGIGSSAGETEEIEAAERLPTDPDGVRTGAAGAPRDAGQAAAEAE
ncbi:MAG: hypothetical protein IRY97_06985, partial [Thermomicrobiaceae bacterium]|nr:hypothetical protein [Thermomicrobiaceae bacterium]